MIGGTHTYTQFFIKEYVRIPTEELQLCSHFSALNKGALLTGPSLHPTKVKACLIVVIGLGMYGNAQYGVCFAKKLPEVT